MIQMGVTYLLKAVIFDMDGVIIDSEPMHLKFEKELFESLAVELEPEEHNQFVGTTSHYMWKVLKNKFNLPQAVEELVKNDREGYFKFLVSGEHNMQMVEGVKELIQELYENGVLLAVASSSPMDVIEVVADLYDIRKYFKELITGDYVDKSKPNPDIFLYAAKKLGVEPKDCIVIEDSGNGVLAAKNAQMKCVGYKNLNSGNQDISPADIIISSYDEISYEKLKNLM